MLDVLVVPATPTFPNISNLAGYFEEEHVTSLPGPVTNDGRVLPNT